MIRPEKSFNWNIERSKESIDLNFCSKSYLRLETNYEGAKFLSKWQSQPYQINSSKWWHMSRKKHWNVPGSFQLLKRWGSLKIAIQPSLKCRFLCVQEENLERKKEKIIHNLNSRQQTLILLFVLTFASAFSKVILTKNIPRTTVHYHKVKKNGWSLCQRGVAFEKNLWEGQAKKSLFQPVLSKCHRVRNFENLIFDKENLWTRMFWA